MSSPDTPEFDTAIVLSDEHLVLRVCEGDHFAFNDLYERYFKRIYSFVSRRLSNTADVEETVQEVFINVFSSVDTYREEAPFSAWIFGIARRTIASRFKKKRHPTVSLESEGFDSPFSDRSSSDRPFSDRAFADRTLVSVNPTAIETIECNQRVKTINRLVESRLTRDQRLLFELHHLQDRPIQEIAETLNMSENAVKSNLYRARKILRGH